MPRQAKYNLVFAPETLDHLDSIDSKFHGQIRSAIREQLSFTPDRRSRNRKPLAEPAALGATWELRFGPKNRFRVLYAINENGREVDVIAIGYKEGNRLFIGSEEIEL